MGAIKKVILGCLILSWLCFLWSNVVEIREIYNEEFQNVVQTELIYDQNYQHYCVEFDGVKKEVESFSEPKNDKIKENYRVMADKKDVICFKYCDEFRVYPKEEYDDNLKVKLCADEMGWPICKLTLYTFICWFIGLSVYKTD